MIYTSTGTLQFVLQNVFTHLGIEYHSHEKREDSLETRTELAILCTYVENQAVPEPILLYQASKCKQTKKKGSEDCLWTHMFMSWVVGWCMYCVTLRLHDIKKLTSVSLEYTMEVNLAYAYVLPFW